MNKVEEVSKKLLQLGYEEQNFNKPKLEDFKPNNELEFIVQLGEVVGDIDVAKSMSDEYHKMILNDFIPDIVFTSHEFDIEIYRNKELVKVTVQGRVIPIGGDGIKASEVVTFKQLSIDDFYKFLIEGSFNIKMLFNNSDN